MTSKTSTREEVLAELKRLRAQHDFDGMLALAQEASSDFPEDAKIWDFLHYAQAHYVEAKLESQIVHQLEKNRDWQNLAIIYQKLLTVFPESSPLRKSLKNVRKEIEKGHAEEVEIFYANAKKQIEEMLDKQEYEKAIAACYEILTSAQDRKEFTSLLAKAEKHLDEQMNNEMEKYYGEIIPMLMLEYKDNKNQFVKL